MNPDHKLFIDYDGYPGRWIDCYPSLNLNGYYWPHAEHSQNGLNYVEIVSNNNIDLAQNDNDENRLLWVVSESEYDIKAGNGIFTRAAPSGNQDENLFVQAGANLTLSITSTPCSNNNNYYKKSRENTFKSTRQKLVNSIELPPIGTDLTTQNASMRIEVFPNPANNKLNLLWSSSLDVDNIIVLSSNGSIIRSFEVGLSRTNLNFETTELANGLYFIQFIQKGKPIKVKKVHVQHN